MEVHDVSPTFLFFQDLSPPFQGKDPFDEIFSEVWIVEASLFLYGKQGEMVHENSCIDADSFFDGHSLFIIDLDPFHATARRIALKNKAAKIFYL
jgi:hypothetical protein